MATSAKCSGAIQASWPFSMPNAGFSSSRLGSRPYGTSICTSVLWISGTRCGSGGG